jgi:hypothetical protein
VLKEYTYVGSCIIVDGGVAKEFSMRTSKGLLTFSYLKHLLHRKDVSLAVIGRVHSASIGPILVCGCEPWSLGMFVHCCLRIVAAIGWSGRVLNGCVREFVSSNGNYHPLSALFKQQGFRWLGHVLRMHRTLFRHQMLFALRERGWRR